MEGVWSVPLSTIPDMELKAVFTQEDPDSLSILTEGAKFAGQRMFCP